MVSEKNDLSFGRDKIISVANMYFNPVVYVTEDSYLATYNVMRLGDIAFEGNRSKRFAHGRFVENTIGDGIVSHVFKVFRPISNDYDLSYWKYAINNEKLMKDVLTRSTKASTMMHELVSDDFLEESTLVPTLAEQRAIGSVIDSIESIITLHQCEPVDRPTYHSLAWEQRKFSELYATNNERNSDCSLGYDRTLSIATMTFNGGNGAADDSLGNYKVIRVGDIAFEGHTNKEHAYGRFVLNDAGDGLMSPRFSCLRPIVEQCYSFWKYYIPREKTMRPILVKATKSGTMMNELVPDDLMRESILVPALDEQEAIGSSLTQLDNLITLHQCES